MEVQKCFENVQILEYKICEDYKFWISWRYKFVRMDRILQDTNLCWYMVQGGEINCGAWSNLSAI